MNSDEEIKRRIPLALSRIRMDAGYSQEQLAELLCVSRNTLRKFEAGQGDLFSFRISLKWCEVCRYDAVRYIEYVYGVRIIRADPSGDRKRLEEFARHGPEDQVHLLAELAAKFEEVNT